MKSKVNYLIILAIFALTACNKEKLAGPAKQPLTTVCKLTSITSVNNINLNTTVTFEYDSKNRLIKQIYRTYTITYVYDQNDFITERTTKYNTATDATTDKFLYNNEKLIAIENSSALKSKTTYEYGSDGKLTKIIKTDAENNRTESFYKNNILIAQTDNLYAYEVNDKGQITKATRNAAGSFSTVGNYTQYYYDQYGQIIKRDNIEKDGKIVNSNVFEFSEIKDLGIGNQDYTKGKGFPIIDPISAKYLIKKETTYLLNRATNTLEFRVGFTSENYKVDKNGRLLSYTGSYKTTNPKDDAIYDFTYNYTGCD
jgi:hypothetical protein